MYRPTDKHDFIDSLKNKFTDINIFESQEKCLLAFVDRVIHFAWIKTNLDANGKECWKRKMLTYRSHCIELFH